MKPLSVSIGQFFKRRYVKCNVYDEYGDNYERVSTFWVRLGTKKYTDNKHNKTRIINLKKTVWDNRQPTLAYSVNGSEPMSFEGNKGQNITAEEMKSLLDEKDFDDLYGNDRETTFLIIIVGLIIAIAVVGVAAFYFYSQTIQKIPEQGGTIIKSVLRLIHVY